MTLQEKLNQHFEMLPPQLQAEVLDFVLFLEQKHIKSQPKKSPTEKLMEIPDIGLDEDFEQVKSTERVGDVFD